MKKRSIYEIDIKVPGDLGSEVTTKRFDKFMDKTIGSGEVEE